MYGSRQPLGVVNFDIQRRDTATALLGGWTKRLDQRFAQPDVVALTPLHPSRRQLTMEMTDLQQALIPRQVEVHEVEHSGW